MPTRRKINKHLRVQILARDSYRCRMCGRASTEVALEVDHVEAHALGGTDELINLAALCRDCNGGKSAYRFSDYRNMEVVPPNLENSFAFFHDGVTGDFQRYHLYLYFKTSVHAGSTDDKFHRTWTISGTAYDTSTDKSAFEQRRRHEEQQRFLVEIRSQLVSERKRLVRCEEGICRIDA